MVAPRSPQATMNEKFWNKFPSDKTKECQRQAIELPPVQRVIQKTQVTSRITCSPKVD